MLARHFGAPLWAACAGKLVLDFGCGDGPDALALAQHGARQVVGLDLDSRVVARATERARAAGVGDRYTFTTATDVVADLVVSSDTFLSAATLALRALPDDSAAVTRRGVEAARTALALEYDRENLGRWLAYDERMARWKQRQQGAKPRPFHARLNTPPGHAVYESLSQLFGILSDGAAHFTPKFLSQQSWRVDDTTEDPSSRLSYFVTDQRSIEQGLNRLATAHMLCLAAFDECYDGAFSRNPDWAAAGERVKAVGRRLVPDPEPDEQEDA